MNNRMLSFILMCLVAVSWADVLGYNYQPVRHSDSGLSFTPGTGFIGGIGVGSSGGSGADFLGDLGDGSNSDVSYHASSYNAPAELTKEFYTFIAPEGQFDDENAAQKISSSVKQGIRVIFIKGPENNDLENAAVALAKQTAEQKTAIYVLNKQADVEDLANKLKVINRNNNNKPEVHFVKYRTPEDAVNAQKAIQSQYDSLGGTSQSHDGVAPVINFASQAPVHSDAGHAPENAYLPSSVFRK